MAATPIRLATICLLAALLAGAHAAAAPIDDAKRSFAEGKAAFERGDYETALAAYQRANLILPAPNLYYNIGATYERLGRYQEAALAFDKYFELAGAPQNDEDRAFQSQLHTRAEADRKRLDEPRAAPQPASPQPRAATPQPYYLPPPGYVVQAPPPALLETRLNAARARRTRAIVLLSIGSALSVGGIIATGYYGGADGIAGWDRFGGAYVGASAFIVGVTLWAPGASSFVRASHDIAELQQQQQQALPPTARGF